MKFASALILTAALALGQSAKKAWTPPLLPSGEPDLQGIWSNATLTPLERPKEFAGKQVLTAEEAAEFAKKQLYDVDGDRRDGGGPADVGRAYNEFWRERGKIDPDRRTSLIVDPPDGRVPALTAEARKRMAAIAEERKLHPADGPEDRSLAERCILVSNGGPPMMPSNYNSNYQIVQSPGYVAILVEMIHDVRIIPIDAQGSGRPHLPQNVRQWMGDPRGHWEGNTLVVETTNFTDKTTFQNSSEKMRLTERFTRTGPKTMQYEFTVDDPSTYAKPWTARIPMSITTGPVWEYACNEGNYGIAGVLSGFRAEEKAAARK